MVVTERAGSWGAASDLALLPTNATPMTVDSELNSVASLSCSSAGNCALAGGYPDQGGTTQAMVAVENAGTSGTRQRGHAACQCLPRDPMPLPRQPRAGQLRVGGLPHEHQLPEHVQLHRRRPVRRLVGVSCRHGHYVDVVPRWGFLSASSGVSHPHQLCHTLATQAINRGMHLEAGAELLGYQNLNMTMVYARIANRTVAEQFGAVIDQVDSLYADSEEGAAETPAMAELRREHRRLLANGWCTPSSSTAPLRPSARAVGSSTPAPASERPADQRPSPGLPTTAGY